MMPNKFIFRYMLTVALLFSAQLVYAAGQKPGPVEVIKSIADVREYRSITLGNGLRVMLVSDASADRAAAALDVNVGSGNDPKDRQGLAHYLEHMLFLGTDKYPESGEYQQYIAENGGSNNAYTVLNHTNYFFNITPEFFAGALDRFAQFFIAPLFNEAYVKRERSVVNSEYQARKDDEGRRLWTARREVYNPEHPATKFSVGSLDTLADRPDDPVRDDLVEFYRRYYHAPRMALAVVSNHSLDQLQEWVEERFSTIPETGESYAPFAEPLILASKLPVEIRLKPIKNTRQLTFSFPIESVRTEEDSKPAQYLSNLLGHEGEGSLLALLKSRAWANGLSASTGFSDDVQATFDISINLSDQGFDHIAEIGYLLFSYIALVREKGIQSGYFDELAQLAELEFRFQEKSSETGLVQGLASRLHRYDAQEVLSAPYLYKEFKPNQIKKILARLTPDNLQLVIVDPDLKSNQKTDWYNVEYRVNRINPDWIGAWREATPLKLLALPEANPFIAARLQMQLDPAPSADLPQILDGVGVESVQIWHQTEVKFKQPKASLYFTLRSIEANATARQSVLTELYVSAIQESLNTYLYPAHLAGLDYQIYRHSRGLSVRISGYSDKKSGLLEMIVDNMRDLNIDQTRFDLYLENITKGLENSLKGRPSSRVIEGIYDILLTSSWSTQEQLDALQTVNLDMLNLHAKALLDAPVLLLLSVGNVSEEDSLRAGRILGRLNMSKRQAKPVNRAKVRRLKPDQWTLQESAAQPDDAAIALIYQGETANIDELAATQLLGSLISTPYYQSLRTEAQLGYIVQAFAFNILDTPALGFSVQSNNTSVGDIVARTQVFLNEYESVLADLPEETYAATKSGLIAQLNEEDKQLGDMASRYWAELDRKAFKFDTRKRLVAAIEKLEKAELLNYLNHLVKVQSSVLLSYSLGDKSTELGLPDGLANSVTYPTLDAMRTAIDATF
jgi:insulysin